MLGIGMQEILIILVVALVVIGPRKLPELARTLGKGFAEFKKAADDLQDSVRKDLEYEKHRDFVRKYPNLVPENGEEAAGTGVEPEAAPSGQSAAGEPEKAPAGEPAPAEEDPPPSYSLDEIEGGEYENEDKDA